MQAFWALERAGENLRINADCVAHFVRDVLRTGAVYLQDMAHILSISDIIDFYNLRDIMPADATARRN